jgi:exopolysaccharide biosynthesis predicted pyruvyltransferase EpsI
MDSASNITTVDSKMLEQLQRDYSELIDILRIAQPLVYFPSSGNGGDALISHATFEFFRRHQLSYELYSPNKPLNNRAIVIGGGGGFVDGYQKMSQLVQRLVVDATSVIILPSSCLGYERELGMMDQRFHFFARESVTAEHVARYANGAKVSLCHDMAFSLMGQKLPTMKNLPLLLRGQPLHYQVKWLLKRPNIVQLLRRELAVTSMLRGDVESRLSASELPRDNYDISHLVKGRMDQEERASAIAQVFCGIIARQKRIVTDRLHVGIACGFLQVPCEMKANNYHKNRAIYEESIKKFCPWVAFSA